MSPTPEPGSEISHIKKVIPPPDSPRAVQVHIWKNAVGPLGIAKPQHPGHAAMQVYENREVVRYVSWWPGEGAGKGNKLNKQDAHQMNRLSTDGWNEISKKTEEKLNAPDGKARPGQYRHRGFINRVGELITGGWMQLPQDSVSIPGLGAPSVTWGLHLPSIATWWDAWSQHQKYVMMSTSNNCAGAVALALKEGGAECYLKEPATWLYISPLKVDEWAHGLQDRLRELDRHFAAIAEKVERTKPVPGLPTSSPIPSKDDWVKYSALKNSSRSSYLRAIDDALGELNKHQKIDGFSVERQRCMVTLVEAIHTHVVTQPASERNGFVLSLAGRILNCIRVWNQSVAPVT
jgi:hypothetical protein